MRDFLQNCCRKRIFFRYLQSERRQEVFPGRNSSAVEHFTRNEGVPSSNLGFGSKTRRLHRRMRPLFRMWQEARAGCAPSAACRKTTAGHRGAPYCAGWSAVQTPQGGSRAWKIPATGGRRHIVVWQTTNPLISKKSGPRVAGIQAVSGEGLAPRGSVPLRRKAGGSRADRQLSAACVAEYGVRRFKTDAHPALHTICRKRKI